MPRQLVETLLDQFTGLFVSSSTVGELGFEVGALRPDQTRMGHQPIEQSRGVSGLEVIDQLLVPCGQGPGPFPADLLT